MPGYKRHLISIMCLIDCVCVYVCARVCVCVHVCVCVCVLLRVPVFVHGNVILVVHNVFFMSTGTPAVKQQVMDRVTPSMR